MAITALNGTLSGSELVYSTSMVDGVYLYIKYTKGNEANVKLEFQLNDENHPSAGEWFYVTEKVTDNVMQIYSVVLDTSISCVIPVPTPESSDSLKVIFTYVGGSTGSIEIWSNTTNKYE